MRRIRRSDPGAPGAVKGENGVRRKERRERERERSNRGWIYGDRVQAVVFLSAAIHHLYQVRGLTFDQVGI